MILTANWDTHLKLARPFIEADIPTLIDKPLVGSISDLNTLTDGFRSPTSVFGGSALPFHPDVRRLPRDVPERTLCAAGYNDYFYYRVHLVDAVRYVADNDWTRVVSADDSESTVSIWFENGTRAKLHFNGPTENPSFGFLDVADRTRTVRIRASQDDSSAMYRPSIAKFLDAVRDVCDETDRLINSALLSLAVELAIENRESITPDKLVSMGIDRDGCAFVTDYEPYY